MIAFGAHTCYQKRFNKVLYFVVMGASEDFLHLTTVVFEIIYVCKHLHACKTKNWRFIIVYKYKYSVVINCG